MKKYKIAIPVIALLAAPNFIMAENAETNSSAQNGRACNNMEKVINGGTEQFDYSENTEDSRFHDERTHKEDMNNVVQSEISRIKDTIDRIEKKHNFLVKVYPNLKQYQEIVLADNPGLWENRDFLSVKKVVALHFNSDKVNCVVIDSEKKNVNYENVWQRKLLRLNYPNIQSLEMESLSHNSRKIESMNGASPEMQLQGLKIMSKHLMDTLYTMDMMIATYHNKKEKMREQMMML